MPHVATEWFSTWFDSPYYHLLYGDRNHGEARAFIDELVAHLHPGPTTRLLDLACGQGRHAVHLSEKGYDVTGLDLSPQSIAYARQFAHEHLRFCVHDMRDPLPYGPFDFVFNLFTSFGYFAHENENVEALLNAMAVLRPGGKLVIDFLNTARAVRELVAREEKTVAGTTFHLHRHLAHDFIVKDIRFTDRYGQEQHFEERVRALSRERFAEYFRLAGLRECEVLGDYHLNSYDQHTSPRMIFVLKK